MKHSTFAKSALALAFGLCATGAMASTEKPVKEDFESYANGTAASALTTENLNWADPEGGSAVKDGKLVVDAATTPTSAEIDNTAAAGINAAVGSHNAKFNATVTFVPATENPTISDTDSDLKFALYAKADSGATNLWVYANGGAQSTGIALTSVVDQTVEVAFTAANTFTVKVGNGSPSSAFTFKNSGGSISKIEFQGNGEVDNIEFSYDANWDSLLGAPVNGAYQIDSLAELVAFQKGVTNGLATANTTFKLTADIALTEAWEGIGIKAGKDLVNGDKKDIPAYEAGAFSGTFDGGNHTISNFQMENGTDYGAFFNSVNGATIMNLKISYKENKLCANSSSTGGDTGATFVGVARNSTLQNLTALAGTVTTVSASKDMAGIVGYLMAGSTVNSCTNELNVASLFTAKARKSGGIALITQDGSGTATIRNCKNSGTVTLANADGQSGGIVGYVGQSTTIIDCENTAAVKMLTVVGSAALTMQGTNKGNATVVSYTGSATPGLNFATVSGNVATFVADNALAAGNTYKVMATGATATYELATEGATISFNTELATPTFAITAAGDLVVEETTSGNVKTFTAAEAPSYAKNDNVTVSGGSYEISADEAAYLNALVEANDATTVETALAGVTGAQLKDAVLLNQDVTKGNAASATLRVESVKRNGGKVVVTVSLTRNGTILGAIRGKIILKACATPNGQFDPVAEQYFEKSAGENSGISQTFTKEFDPVAGKTFFKAEVVPVPAE